MASHHIISEVKIKYLMCIFYEFLAGIKQLYEWFGPSVRHTFFTMFPGDSSRENQGRRPTLLLSLRPQGHAFNIACPAIIKTYNSMLPVSLCDNGCWGTSMVASEICEKCTVGLDLFNHNSGELWEVLERKLPPFGHPQSGTSNDI